MSPNDNTPSSPENQPQEESPEQRWAAEWDKKWKQRLREDPGLAFAVGREHAAWNRIYLCLAIAIKETTDLWDAAYVRSYLHGCIETLIEPHGFYEAEAKVSRKALPAEVRTFIMERDEYRCQICNDWHELSIDHINPVSKGGTNDIDNLRVLCRSCNSRKGNRV